MLGMATIGVLMFVFIGAIVVFRMVVKMHRLIDMYNGDSPSDTNTQ